MWKNCETQMCSPWQCRDRIGRLCHDLYNKSCFDVYKAGNGHGFGVHNVDLMLDDLP